MKKRILCLLSALLLLLFAAGCKAQEEIVNVPTPKPETQTVVVKQDKEEPEHCIEVVGNGEITAVPDFVTIVLGVSARGDTAEAALIACQEQVLKGITAAAQLGVYQSKIALRGVEIAPTDRENADSAAYYTATDVMTVGIGETAMARELLAKLLDAGGYAFHSITYSLTESSEAYRSALIAATEDARLKAEALAEATGVRLGNVIGITETVAEEELAAGDHSKSGSIAISATVTVRYKIG